MLPNDFSPEMLIVAFIVGNLLLLPTIVAFLRNKKSLTPIFIYNLLLGWTVLGWFAALCWACVDDSNTGTEVETTTLSTDSRLTKVFDI